MGRNVSAASSASSSQPVYYTTVTVGEDVQQGQIAVLGEDNLAYYGADPAVPANSVRPIVNLTPIINAILMPAPARPTDTNGINSTNQSSSWGGLNCIAGAALSNGNYVVAWQLNSGNFPVQFAIFNNAGQQQGAVVTVDGAAATGTTAFCVSIAALTGGGFALAFGRTVAPWVQYGVYDNNGAVVKALTAVNAAITGVGGGGTQIYALALSNGGFALAYMNTSVPVTAYAVYDATGTVVKANTALAGGGNGFVQGAAFSAAQGGGFVIAYSTQTNGTMVQKFKNDGTAVAAAAATGGGNSNYSAVTPNGNAGGFAVASLVSANLTVTLYNTNGIQAAAPASAGAVSTGATYPRIVGLANGDVAVAMMGSGTNITLAFHSGTTGKVLKSYTYAQIPLTYNSNADVSLYATKAGGLSLIGMLSGGSLQCAFDANYNLAAPYVALPTPYVPYGNTPPVFFPLVNPVKASADLAVLAGQTNTGGLFVGQIMPYMPRFIPLGVYTNNAAKGQTAQVQYTGSISLAVGFQAPYNVDAQSQTPPGQRMSIVGNSVIMNGMQSSSRVRRNIN
ncbi:hypothetical protein GTP45_27555 [Pseudoduganella sp. FT55W]|uniref:Uncharacterized protein n=1 Tax=Duganella rivi TaxID=2666083 RepID=A0A7X4KEL4_9BURK|nr:hypothetical protein [Duganella rivi]MYM70539.1 hypothetical protein [Duganella rivi]